MADGLAMSHMHIRPCSLSPIFIHQRFSLWSMDERGVNVGDFCMADGCDKLPTGLIRLNIHNLHSG